MQYATSLSLFLSLGSFSSRTIQRAPRVISRPWPTSPNITANRKGKVMMVYTAAKASRHETQLKVRVRLSLFWILSFFFWRLWVFCWCAMQTYLGWLRGSWPLRRPRQCSGSQLWRSWWETEWAGGWRKAAGCRTSQHCCHSSSEDGEESWKKIVRRFAYLFQVSQYTTPSWSHPSLSQGALQLRQLGDGTPGLSDQAFVRDGGAAEVQHRLDRLTLLHTHLPLGQHRHRPHQQLLQEGLGLQQHLKKREGSEHNSHHSSIVLCRIFKLSVIGFQQLVLL